MPELTITRIRLAATARPSHVALKHVISGKESPASTTEQIHPLADVTAIGVFGQNRTTSEIRIWTKPLARRTLPRVRRAAFPWKREFFCAEW